MPPTTRAAAAAAASQHSNAIPKPLDEATSTSASSTTVQLAAPAAPAALPLPQNEVLPPPPPPPVSFPQTRQTRRNTQTVSNDQGTHVMDPWKDDRLRDFVAINVLTRLKSFHLPVGAPLASAGSINRQRVDQLYLLPRTASRCAGDAVDCPLRRTFCKIFGPAVLHHEQHSPSAVVMVEGGTYHTAATPLQMPRSEREGAACSALESPDPTIAPLQPVALPLSVADGTVAEEDGEAATRRSLFMDEDEGRSDVVAAGNDVGMAVPVAAGNEVPSQEEPVPTPAFAPAPTTSLARGSSMARGQSAATTAGSATPADYRADLDCGCCTECVDVMCAHFQSLLTRGVIFDRFSQKELLFAHWVLFQNMEGSSIDSHGALARREALSIHVKSGYYDLLKVPRAAEDDHPPQATTSPLVASSSSPTGAAAIEDTNTADAAHHHQSATAPFASSAVSSVLSVATRKRNRGGTFETKVKIEEQDDAVVATAPSLNDTRRLTRRTEGAAAPSTTAAPSPPPAATGVSIAAEDMPPPPQRKPRANQYTKARDAAIAAAAAAAAAAATVVIKQEEPASPSIASTRVSTPTTSAATTRAGSTRGEGADDTKPQSSAGWTIPPTLSLGAPSLSQLSLMNPSRLSRYARVKQREEEAALLVLLGYEAPVGAAGSTPTSPPPEDKGFGPPTTASVMSQALAHYQQLVVDHRRPTQSTRDPLPPVSGILVEGAERRRAKKSISTPQKSKAMPAGAATSSSVGFPTSTRTSRRSGPSNSDAPAIAELPEDDVIVTDAAVAAMAEEPLRHFTFEQQCLLLLAASRIADPLVAVGPHFLPAVNDNEDEEGGGGVASRGRRATIDYWSPAVAAATLDPQPRGSRDFSHHHMDE